MTNSVRVGAEFRVNTATASVQQDPDVTALPGGGFVVTWVDYSLGVGGAGGDASGGAIKGQRYDAAGAAAGAEFRINTATLNDQFAPAVAGLPGGAFVVVWADNSTGANGPGGRLVRGQRYDAAGAPQGPDFIVNTLTQDASAPGVAALAGGGFVVTWTALDAAFGSLEVRGQLYGAGGARVGGEFQVAASNGDNRTGAAVAALTGGGFVVSWFTLGVGDGSGRAIKGQLLGSTGARAGGEFQVNAATAGDQDYPSVTALAGGGFVVTWQDASLGVGGAGGDASGTAIKGQVYGATGALVGGEFLVNAATAGAQGEPDVSALAGGGFVVTWTDLSLGVGGAGGDASLRAIKGQLFGATGAPLGGEFLVNTATAGNQFLSSVAALSGGGFAVAWTDASAGVGGAGGDATSDAVKAQLYRLNADPGAATDANGAANAVLEGAAAGTVVNLTAGALDPDGDAVTYSLADDAGGAFAIDAATGVVTVREGTLIDYEQRTALGLTVRAADAFGGASLTAFTVAVLDVSSERLSGTGGPDLLVGGAGADRFRGLGGDDVLVGGGGPDLLDGGAGTDTASYVTATARVIASLTNAAVNAGDAAGDAYLSIENLTGSAFDDVLIGDAGANRLEGGAGSDSLVGAAGADAMVGGAGDDYYYVDDVGDTVVEGVNGGLDRVFATVSFTLADDVEALFLQGAGVTGIGNAGDNTIVGNGLDNVLSGGNGSDYLVDGGGTDTLIGGAGDDFYFVSASGAAVIEGAGGGYDRIFATVSIVMADDVEALILQGGAVVGIGNAGDNGIIGNALDNVLSGGAGSDLLYGFGGADTFVFRAGYGADTVGDFQGAGAPGGDALQIDPALAASFAAFQAAGSQVGSDAVYTFGAGTSLTLLNVNFAGLIAADVVFA